LVTTALTPTYSPVGTIYLTPDVEISLILLTLAIKRTSCSDPTLLTGGSRTPSKR